jgi:hypothetical protein
LLLDIAIFKLFDSTMRFERHNGVKAVEFFGPATLSLQPGSRSFSRCGWCWRLPFSPACASQTLMPFNSRRA